MIIKIIIRMMTTIMIFDTKNIIQKIIKEMGDTTLYIHLR